MEIKEQVKEKEVTEKLALFIRDDINKFGLTKDISDIPAFANTILNNFIIPFLSEWLKDNNYLQIQAGEDGLLADEEIQELYDSDDYGDGFALWEEIAIRQKALDDKEKEEAVKKVFDWFLSRSYPEDDVIEITFSKTELDTFKQTLEEL